MGTVRPLSWIYFLSLGVLKIFSTSRRNQGRRLEENSRLKPSNPDLFRHGVILHRRLSRGLFFARGVAVTHSLLLFRHARAFRLHARRHKGESSGRHLPFRGADSFPFVSQA